MVSVFYVYFIQEQKASKSAPVKIGVAQDVIQRLMNIQTGNPRTLKIVATLGPFSEAQAFDLERGLHRRFKSLRLRGEWFSGKALKMLGGI